MVSDAIHPPSHSLVLSPGTPAESVCGFQYEPLDTVPDTIRLLELQPRRNGEDETVVRCKLIHSNFLSKPNYEALSYTWGDPSSVKHIYVNDFEFPVRENLYSALFCLRLTESRLIWANAICIDQSNYDERRYQVRLMAFIYERAQCVLVWLGLHPFHNGQDIFEKVIGPSGYNTKEINWLIDHEYWSRLWVIQEIRKSRTLKVYSGRAHINWGDFMKIASSIRYYSRAKNSYILNLDTKRKGRRGDANRLETLLEDFRYAKCAEPRDTIYGFLGLAHDLNNELETDYSKSLSDLHADVIHFFCRRRVLSTGSMNDLDRSMRVMRFSQLILRRLQEDGDIISNLPITNDTIHIRGAIGGQILHLGPTYTDMLSSYDANTRWKLSFGRHYSLPQNVQILREANESYIAILLQMAPTDVKKVRGINPGEMYSAARKVNKHWNSDERRWSHLELDSQIGRDMADIPKAINLSNPPYQPRMFLGNSYLFGLAPAEAKAGDLICHFWNCNVVAILRPEETTGLYRIIGRVNLSTGALESDLTPIYANWKDPVKDAKVVYIQMDINTLSTLSC